MVHYSAYEKEKAIHTEIHSMQKEKKTFLSILKACSKKKISIIEVQEIPLIFPRLHISSYPFNFDLHINALIFEKKKKLKLKGWQQQKKK